MMFVWVCMAAVIYVAGGTGFYIYVQREKHEGRLFLAELLMILFASFFSLKLASYSSFGDAGDFQNMMEAFADGSIRGLYARGGISYPPLFWLIYYIVYLAMQLTGIPIDAGMRAFVFAIRFPCILMEFLVVWLCCRCMENGEGKQGRECLVCYLSLMNPAVLFTTAFVCQVDMLYIGFLVFTVYLLAKKKLITAYFCFAASVLLKLQAVFLTPLVLLATAWQVFGNGICWRNFWKKLTGGLLAIAAIFVSYLPLLPQNGGTGQGGFWNNFTSSIQSFGKGSQNACNFWMLVGFNQVPVEEKFGLLSCHAWGTLFLVLLVVAVIVLFWHRKGVYDVYPLVAAVLVAGTYTFAVKMMSRYLYPVVFLLLSAFVLKQTKGRFWCALLYSALYILVVGMDYLVYPWTEYHRGLAEPYLVSAVAVLAFFLFFAWVWKEET